MGDDSGFGIHLLEALNLFRPEHLVYRAEPLPENDPRIPDLLLAQPPHWLLIVPHHHLIERNPHCRPGVSTQMLIREEEHLLPLRKGPLQHVTRIGGGADNPTMAAAKPLQVCCRVDIGDRGNLFIGTEYGGELLPCPLHTGKIGHIGHRTAGTHVGNNGELIRA